MIHSHTGVPSVTHSGGCLEFHGQGEKVEKTKEMNRRREDWERAEWSKYHAGIKGTLVWPEEGIYTFSLLCFHDYLKGVLLVMHCLIGPSTHFGTDKGIDLSSSIAQSHSILCEPRSSFFSVVFCPALQECSGFDQTDWQSWIGSTNWH